MMPKRDHTRGYLILLLTGFLTIGYVFSQMEADVAVALVGKSVRGTGNHMIRAEMGGLITDVYAQEGDDIRPNQVIVSLDPTEVLDQISALDVEIIGAEAVIASSKVTHAIYETELATVEKLVKQGLEPKSELRRARLDLALSEAGLVEAQGKLDVYLAHKERLVSKLERYQVPSMDEGKLLKMIRYARGDVIKPGDVIAEIIPTNEPLFFETRVPPDDITSVSIGNQAKITLQAANRYEVEPLRGTVEYVSPSSLTDEDGREYFIARIALNEGEEIQLEGVLDDVGHLADISIKSGQRSVLAFIMSPLVRGAERVFKER